MIGFMAATLTTVSFLPQVIQVWKTKSTKDISLGMFSIFSSGVFLWLVYGILIEDWAVFMANSITLILASIILTFKLKYK
nr:SemiSWEET transporter [Planktothricoides sp. SR001]